MSDVGCDPSGNSISSFHVRTDILHLLFLYDFFLFFHVEYMLDVIEQHIYHFFLSLFYLKDEVIVYED